ncbi:MAG: hypothetical protein AAB581_01550 [Patescibacteria group bacterium]
MKTVQQLIIHSSPLALGIVLSYLLWRENMLLLVVYTALVAALIVAGKDRKVETVIFLYGAVVGFVIEAIGTQVSGYQTFVQPDMLGIPFWLIVAWGYGFLLMKRIGFIITTGSPWASDCKADKNIVQ